MSIKMAHQQHLEKAKYRQWVKAGLGIGYLKDGLAPFCQTIAEQQHRDIIDHIQRQKNCRLPVTCGVCHLRTLKPDHVKVGNKVCPFGQTNCNCWFPNGKIACPNNICGAIYDSIIQSHASNPPAPNWKNTDSQQWTVDPWSIAKCFINAPGYYQKTSSADTDSTGLLNIMINNRYYHSHVSCTITGQNIFLKVRLFRNEIFHSSSMELEESESNQYIDDMISILQDGKELVNDPDAQEAVLKLQALKTTDFIITSNSTEKILDHIEGEMEKSEIIENEDAGYFSIEEEKIGQLDVEKKLKVQLSEEIDRKLKVEKENAELKKELEELKKLIKNFRVIMKQLWIAYLEEEQKRTMERTGEQQDEENAMSDLSEVKEKRVDTNDDTAIEGVPEMGKDTDSKEEGVTDPGTDITVQGKTGDIAKPSNDFATKESPETGQTPDTTKTSWNDCIGYAKLLVERKTLPSQSEVNEACRVFGRHSTILSDMCSLICEHIKLKSSNVINVWPAYVIDDNITSVVFVVVLGKESDFSGFDGYDCKLSIVNKHNDEGKLVASEKLKDESIYREYGDILKQMRVCINKNADNVFNRHSNLNVILPSLRKSTGYKSGKHDIKVLPCIALYVTSKGCIPLKEEPFEKEIGGFPIDILEGEFTPFAIPSTIQMGSAVHGNDSLGGTGTLGGFVDHPKHGLCGLTCAHVVYSTPELTRIKDKNFPVFKKQVYGGTGEGSSNVGEAVFDEGTETVAGVDVALFKIQMRRPIDGFLLAAVNQELDENNQLCFNSGKVCETANLDIHTSVYKFGVSSGFTRGCVGLQGVALRKKPADGPIYRDFRYYLKDQIVICSLLNEPEFALPGDSGALVLMKEHKDSVAVGLVQGGVNSTGEILVTPICDVLRAVGCKEMKMHQFKQYYHF